MNMVLRYYDYILWMMRDLWFVLDGSRMMVCGSIRSGDVRQKEHGYIMVASNSLGYNTQKGGHKELLRYRCFDVSQPRTRESRQLPQ